MTPGRPTGHLTAISRAYPQAWRTADALRLWIDGVKTVHAMGKDIPSNQYVTILTTMFRRAKFA